jgi:hypothetical protein
MALFTSQEPRKYEIKEKPLACHHCGNELFYLRGASLHPGTFTAGLDWAERPASALVCSECGFIHWFMEQ